MDKEDFNRRSEMANDVNEAKISGTVGKFITTREFGQGQKLVNFSVASKSSYNGKDSYTYMNISAFGPLVAEASSLVEGQKVYVEGKFTVKTTEKDGVKKTYHSITATKITSGEKPVAAAPTAPSFDDFNPVF